MHSGSLKNSLWMCRISMIGLCVLLMTACSMPPPFRSAASTTSGAASNASASSLSPPPMRSACTQTEQPSVLASVQPLDLAMPSNHAAITHEKRMIFDDFLANAKALLAEIYKTKPYPKVFISYAWEDEQSTEGKSANKGLQKRLITLQEDLESLGIETFIDLKYMQGHMRQTMKQHLDAADFVIVIGTPRLKKRAAQDRLFLAPYFDPKAIPKTGNQLVLVEGRDAYALYYLEEAQLKEIITLPFSQLEFLSHISWNQKGNMLREAPLSAHSNQVLEFLLTRLKHRSPKRVSNVQFELGIALDRAERNSKMLIPLMLQGSYAESFPKVMHNNLVRSLDQDEQYYAQMSSLSNPLGIMVTICPELMRNREYAALLSDFRKASKQ